jgi:hypothetical protein
MITETEEERQARLAAELKAHEEDRVRLEAVYTTRIAQVKAEKPGVREQHEIDSELEALEKDLQREMDRSEAYRARVADAKG